MIHHDIIRRAIEGLPILDVIDAHELADTIIDRVINELMRDPYTQPRCCREWAVALADTRARIVEQIHHRIHGHVHIDDVLNTLEMEGVS
jgi:hypothetical protein